jgi:hypothetical protein
VLPVPVAHDADEVIGQSIRVARFVVISAI